MTDNVNLLVGTVRIDVPVVSLFALLEKIYIAVIPVEMYLRVFHTFSQASLRVL